MCEITISFGRKLTAHEIYAYSSMRERGRGFALVYPRHVHLVKGLVADEVNTNYFRAPEPLLTVFHSRLPSAGDINLENTQPFVDERRRRAFCHNGHLGGRVMAVLQAAVPWSGPRWSDSLLLWEFIKSMPSDRVVKLLREFDDRFVWVDLELEEIHLIGAFVEAQPGLWIRPALFSERQFRYARLDLRGHIKDAREVKLTYKPPFSLF